MYPNRIRYWRKHRGLTQVDLAKILDTNQTSIGRLETGQLDLSRDWADRIAAALDLAHGILLWPWSVVGAIRDDLELLTGPSPEGIQLYKAISDSMKDDGIDPGAILTVTTHTKGKWDADVRPPGSIFVLDVKTKSDTGHGKILRELASNGLLCSKGPGARWAFRPDDPDLDVTVSGTVIKWSKPGEVEVLSPFPKQGGAHE